MNKQTTKAFSVFLAVWMFFNAMSAAVFAEEEPAVAVFLDGTQLQFDVAPVIENDRVLVPMRTIFEALGADVLWVGETKTAIAQKDGDTMLVTVNVLYLQKNGQQIPLDVPARLMDDRTLVPLRAISEGWGADVVWDGEQSTVIITTKGAEIPTVEPVPTSTPAASPAAQPEDGSYSYNELSPADMQLLKDSYDEIRYAFEQLLLPQLVLVDNTEVLQELKQQSDAAKALIFDRWNQTVFTQIIQIQVDSESTYEFYAGDEAELYEGYLALAREAGLEAHDYFDVSFEPLEDGSIMLLLTFNETDTFMACKYIGVVVSLEDAVRYFTDETDIFTTDTMFFCEVTASGRGTLGFIGFEKNDFITAVEQTVAQH